MKDESDRLRTALDLYRAGDLARAQMLLELVDVDRLERPLQVEAMYMLGLVLARRGDLQDAAARFRACTQIDRGFYPALDAWGNALGELGDLGGAVDKYRRALAVADRDQSAHIQYNFGQTLFKRGQVLRALRRFRDSYQARPSGDAAFMAGSCFLKMRRTRGAERWMQRALDADNRCSRNWIGMGQAAELKRNTDYAERCFRRALEFEPASTDAHYHLALVLASRGSYFQAVRQCKAGLRHDPDAFELLTHQAWCLRQMGAYDAALQAGKRTRALAGTARGNARVPGFLDLVTSNDSACLRALGRPQQARARLLQQLRSSHGVCANCLSELRYIDRRRGRNLRTYELTLRARPAARDPDAESGGAYVRTYWVLARDIKAARRMARELEPSDAEIRFEQQDEVGDPIAEADRGVIERSQARRVD